MSSPTIRIWYAIVVAFIACAAIAAAAVLYTDQVQRESDQRWCALVGTLDDAYRSTPPTSPTGRNVAAEMARLRASLGCPPPLNLP